MSELQDFTLKELQAKFDEKNGTWLYNIARGIDLEPVQARFNPKSIGCCKQLRGKSALADLESLKKWLFDLGQEIEDRLEKDAVENNRTPKQMVVSFSTSLANGRDVSSSRSYNFSAEDELCGEFFSSKALELVMETTEGIKLEGIESNRRLKAPIKFLGISVGKFEDNTENKKNKKILDYFGAGKSKEKTQKNQDIEKNYVAVDINKNKENYKEGKEYLLKKFFQNTADMEEKCPMVSTTKNENKVKASLEEQESFFAKLLNGSGKVSIDKYEKSQINLKEDLIQPATAVCDRLNYGENSNDTNYSTSTIDMEINKSIALFEEDPTDKDRVSNMRQLLNSTIIQDDNKYLSEKSCPENHSDEQITNSNDKDSVPSVLDFKKSANNSESDNNSVQCPECKQAVSIDELHTHADYHFALKLRDEEKLKSRLEIRENNKTAQQYEETRSRQPGTSEEITSKTSIANFLIKIDSSVPIEICTECSKKVPKHKLAEHLDFHEAQKLSRELNKKTVSVFPSYSSVKRKRVSTSPVKKLKLACKSIDSFFK